jgi:uncharacterized protein
MAGILDFLVPREKKFIRLLMQQSDIVSRGASEFDNFITKYNDLNVNERINQRNLIRQIEHEGDHIIRVIIDGLHETFITPFDGEDILSLTQSMDDILDLINETAGKITVYKVKNMPPEMKEFSKRLLECCQIIKNSMYHLKDYKEIKRDIMRIHDIETDADRIFFQCVSDLFEKKHKIRHVIKFKEIYQDAEKALDMCKIVGDILGKIVVKHG